MKFFSLVAAASALSVASATNFTVLVGENGSLTYNPTSVNASVGDTIAFQFVAKNHTVTQSTFADPCTEMAGGVDSGFFPVAANATEVPQWSFTVNNDSAPLWFYCRQTGHCAMGMVFAVNPTATKSFEAFQAAANATGSNSTTSASGAAGSASAGTGSSTAGAAGTSASSGTSTGAASGALSSFGMSTRASALALFGALVSLAL